MNRRGFRWIRMLRLLSWRQAAIGIAILLVVPNLPLLLGIDAPTWDASSYFGPNWMLVADHAREAKFLLWNPFVDAGSPDGAQPEYGAFSPLTVGLGALFGGTLTGFVVYTLTLWLLAALGMLTLARHLGAPPWAGFVVACGWAFSGTFTGHFQHTSWFCAYAFIPWVVWRVDASLAEHRFVPAMQAGALLGLAGLSGYPTIVIQTGILATLWAAGRALTGATPAGDRRALAARLVKHAVTIVVVALVAVVVLAPSWFAFVVESKGYTWRAGALPREIAVHQNALHPGALATFASPYLHVVAALWAPERWAPSDGSSLGCYAGAAIGAFALFALVGRRSPWVWWLLGVAAFHLATSTDVLPLRGLLYDLFPWERLGRHGSQRKDFALFLFAVIALHAGSWSPGGRASGIARSHARLFARCVVAVAAAAALSASVAWAYLGSLGPRPAFAVTHFLVVWGGLLLAAMLWRDSRRSVLRLAPGVLVLLALVDAGGTVRLSRVLMVDGGLSRNAWDRIALEKHSSIDLTGSGLFRDRSSPDWAWPKPSNQNVPLRLPVFESYSALTNRYHAATAKEPLLLRTALGRERVWFAPGAEVAVPDIAAWKRLVGTSRNAGSALLVVHAPETMAGAARLTRSEEVNETARSTRSDRDRLLLPVATNVLRYFTGDVQLSVAVPQDGWILFTDRWARGWKGSVDGADAPVWGANFIFRGVRVRAGTHIVRFVYQPAGYPWLLLLSWGTLGAIAAGAVRRSLRRSTSGATRDPGPETR